jgi:hypothetical protein
VFEVGRRILPAMAGTERSPIWFAVVGGAVGLAVGILVSVTTDVPLAPEAGLLLGALLGWVAYRTRRR